MGCMFVVRGEELNKYPSSTVQSYLGTAIPEQPVGGSMCRFLIYIPVGGYARNEQFDVTVLNVEVSYGAIDA